MKSKSGIMILILAAVLMSTMTGCQLAIADKGADAGENRLAGVLVTTEYLDLFDMKSYLNDNGGKMPGGNIITDGNAKEYQGRLYATRMKQTQTNETGETTETDDYVFPGVKGMSFFSVRVSNTEGNDCYQTATGDEAITDCHTSIHDTDLENSVSLEGTVYTSPISGPSSFFLNPVYQSADGRLYVTTGTGLMFGNAQSEGTESAQSMTSSLTRTENGKTVKESTSVKLTFKVMNPPNKIVVVQMDAASAAVSRQEYAPEAVPKAITPERNAEYIVVETYKTDCDGNAQVARMVYGKDAQWLDTFHCRQNGICVKQSTQLDWAK